MDVDEGHSESAWPTEEDASVPGVNDPEMDEMHVQTVPTSINVRQATPSVESAADVGSDIEESDGILG